MIYSCFDAPSGLYRYFQDDKQQALNGDLPVPKFSSGAMTKAGVPAVAAARPFPSGATYVGTGWAAKGMIVQCPGSGQLGSLFDTSTWPSWWPYAAGAVGGALAYFLLRRSR